VSVDQELDGTTLRIYIALVNEGKPLGPREITRIVGLSSPSVAYRNLQKLEELNLVEKNAYGEYVVKQRQSVKGHFLVGGRLYPRLFFYSFFFVGVLIIEALIAATRLWVGEKLQYDFILLIIVTSLAIGFFMLEGIASARFGNKNQPHK
jgi:hypothetical protein